MDETLGDMLPGHDNTGDQRNGLLHRLGERDRPKVQLEVDGAPITALQGDTLLVALLTNQAWLRQSEFGDGARAGFCLMGACQDCWVWTADGARLRACSTPVESGMRIVTRAVPWPTARL
jgi:predicted molibdopterin-dependent oxidoreductase YjgC